MLPQDFSKRKTFPGNSGNNFDLVFKPIDAVQFLFAPLFALLLLALAFLASRFDPVSAIILFGFYIGDWILISMLPRVGKSFGPPKPPVFLLALLRAVFALLPFPWWIAVELVGTGLVMYSFWIEPHRLSLTHQTLQSPKLGFKRPLRVLHLADIHVERLTKRERALLDMVKSLAPDVILFSGDFLNLSFTQDALAQEHARSVLVELDAPLGVYVVSGSPAVDPPEVVSRLLEGMNNLRWLRQERAVLEHEGKQIEIVGLDCTHRPFVDGPNLLQTLNGSGHETFRILLYHSPDLAPQAAQAGMDLQLSGHTHGGQVRLPLYGALYAGSLYGKKFESGRTQVGDLTLYVSRGIGLEGGSAPRLRFNCAPEVILWEIR
jgi:predicted MPP superfamily phosphohydrolase